ncbi:helix-turn-helix domain-containing protein [Metabacillus arenae]|uniref:Helix-turn-helix transcriptional regulator n=1 Tax=Metabacillus arenae TaxID=2771434 RepID=A0A926ND78_9BACI|nr:helix-turn-helix transcriptional regulator [Metabacillus arenae]MBD1379076.1 helix-turn-helix transcriptional regulator [Metabacillus arenae]
MNYITQEEVDNTFLGQVAEKEQFIEENKEEWLKIGSELQNKRLELGISVSQLSKLLGTSDTRIRNFESGEPVMMSNHLISTYKLALELTKMKQEQKLANFTL